MRGRWSCAEAAAALGDLSMLYGHDTTFALISRAPLAKLEAYKAQKGWNVPWYSSFGSDFNYDFHVTLDESVAPIEYNYRTLAEMKARKGPNGMKGEEHGLSVFLRLDDNVFPCSIYARGTEGLTDAYTLLDTTHMDGNKALKTRLQVGLSSRPMDRLTQVRVKAPAGAHAAAQNRFR
jgi:predicted dithiol-disulfide oxidoreductase (DUF899 family)